MSRLILVFAAVVAACSGKKETAPDPKAEPPRPAAISDDDAALAEKWAELYAEYASGMVASQGDCKLAREAVLFTNRDRAELIAKAKPRMAALRSDPAAASWLDEKYRKRLGAELDRMAPILDKCRGDAELSAALAAGAFERQPR